MELKHYIWLGIFIGSTVGGIIGGALDHGNFLGLWGILLGGVGAILGIWGGYRLGNG